jgi:hypothetical protein
LLFIYYFHSLLSNNYLEHYSPLFFALGVNRTMFAQFDSIGFNGASI